MKTSTDITASDNKVSGLSGLRINAYGIRGFYGVHPASYRQRCVGRGGLKRKLKTNPETAAEIISTPKNPSRTVVTTTT
jgi:hypothetical protein